MAWQKGQSGNPNGSKSEKVWAQAVRMALSETDKAAGIKKLRLVADKLVAEAIDGNIQAMKEIGDRLDGKPAQSMELTGDPEAPLQVVSAKPLDPEAWAKAYGKD